MASHQSKSSEADQFQTTLSDEDNMKQKAMSLLGQYIASKKAQITQTGIEMSSDTGMSNSATSAESSAAMGQELSSIHALPVSEKFTVKLWQYNNSASFNVPLQDFVNHPV